MGISLLDTIGYTIVPQFNIRGKTKYMYRIPTKLHFEAKDITLPIGDKSYMETQVHTFFANIDLDYLLFLL